MRLKLHSIDIEEKLNEQPLHHTFIATDETNLFYIIKSRLLSHIYV